MTPPMLVRALARWCLSVGLCCVAWPVAARAPILPGLSWVRLEGAESCVSSIGLAQRIEDKLGRAVFVPTSAAELTIEGYVAPRSEGGYAAHLSVVAMDGRVLGTRVLETSSTECQELDQALVLVIAVTLYPDTALGGVSMLSPDVQASLDQWLNGDVPTSDSAIVPAQPPPATVNVPRPDRDDAPAAQPEVEHPPPAQEGLRLDAALIGGGGMLPSPVFGAELAITVIPDQFLPLMFTLQGFLPRQLPAPGNDRGDVTFLLGRVGALLCPQQGYGVLSIDGCVGIDTGIMYVTSSGFRFDGSTIRPVLDLLVQPNVRVRVSDRWSLRFGAAIGVPLVAPEITTRTIQNQVQNLFSVSPVTLTFHIGLSVSL